MAHLLEYVGNVHIFLGPYRGNPIALYLLRGTSQCEIAPKIYPWNEVLGKGETPNNEKPSATAPTTDLRAGAPAGTGTAAQPAPPPSSPSKPVNTSVASTQPTEAPATAPTPEPTSAGTQET